MAFLHSNSFDYYTTLSHETYVVANGAISAGNGRFSTASYRSTSNGNQSTSHYLRKTITQGDVFIVNLAFRCSGLPAANRDYMLAGLIDGENLQCAVVLKSDGKIYACRSTGNAFFNISLGGGGLTSLGADSSAIAVDVYYHLQIKFTIHNSTGSIVVKRDGATVISTGSVDTQQTGNAFADGILMGYLQDASSPSNLDFDDWIVMDDAGSYMNDFIGEKRIGCLFPTAEGTTIQWTPSTGADNSALVDETAPNDDTDYVSSSNVGDKDTYVMQNLPSTAAGVSAVVVKHRARKDDAGVRQIAARVRSGSSEAVGDTKTMASSYEYHHSVFYTDPNTSPLDVWTSGAVDSMEVGSEVIA